MIVSGYASQGLVKPWPKPRASLKVIVCSRLMAISQQAAFSKLFIKEFQAIVSSLPAH